MKKKANGEGGSKMTRQTTAVVAILSLCVVVAGYGLSCA